MPANFDCVCVFGFFLKVVIILFDAHYSHVTEHLINILMGCIFCCFCLNYKRLLPSWFCIICVCVWDRLLLTLTLAWSNWFTIILLKCYYTIQLRVFLCWILRGRVLFSFPFCWLDVLLGKIAETILPSFLRWRSISSWSVLSWINGRVDGRNDSNQTTKLAGIVVGSERTQIVSISHT